MLTYPNIDPVIFDIYGPLKLRWYSLGYMIGIFFGAYFASQQLKKQGKISKSVINIVGCTPEKLKEHIESKFVDNMSWDNYGYRGWHLDHIIPLCTAKTIEEVYSLNHYTNLQPLWAIDNMKKGKKIMN